eukprot:2922021-Rhodomonas_salina.2
MLLPPPSVQRGRLVLVLAWDVLDMFILSVTALPCVDAVVDAAGDAVCIRGAAQHHATLLAVRTRWRAPWAAALRADCAPLRPLALRAG